MTTLIISVSSSATNAAGTAFGQQPDQLAPSFFDMKVTSSTNPVIGNGVYDAYCINPLVDIFVAPTSYAADSYEASNPTSFQQIKPTEVDLSSLSQAQVDQLNWILSQNLTSDPKYAGRFNYGEVQVAIWRVLGFTQAEINSAGLDRFLNDNNRQVVSLTDVDFLVNAAQSAVASGQYVSPPPGTNFTMLIDPSPKTGTEPASGIQPLIVQLANAKLGNFVWFDSDADGLQDANESGVDNLVVELWKDGVKVASTVTGDDFSTAAIEHGFYQFAGLAAGDYQVKFVAPDYAFTSVDANLNSQDQEDSDANPATGFSQVVHLNAGESNQTIDAGLVAPGTAKISGYVYEDQGNDGVRNAEPPIAGVTITLSGVDDLGNAVNATTTTDANGYYEFTDLRPGTYTVTETQPANYLDGKDTAGSTGGSVSNDLISAIPLAAGQHSQENNFGELPPAKISGYVYEDQGNDGVRNAEPPIAGVTVSLSGTDDLGNAVNATTTTDANGYYEFTGLRPGTYAVTELQPANYLDGKDTAGSTGGSVSNDLISAIPLAAGEHSQENNFGELPPAKLSGYVYEDQGNDGVRNAEPPIAGVTITLSGVDDLGNAVNATTTTDANGYYEFTDLRPGTYAVTETQPGGYIDGKDTVGTAGGSNAVNDTLSAIVLVGGTNSVENNFGELKTASLGDRVWYDTNANGQQDFGETGANGVTVTLTAGGADGQLSTTADNTTQTTTTAGDGNYLFTNLTPGQQYQVTFGKPGGYNFTTADSGNDNSDSDADTVSGKSQIVTLANGESNLTIDAGLVAQKAAIGDDVWLDCNANGIQDSGEVGVANVTVKLLNSAGTVIATQQTNANGDYLFSNLNPGDYAVQFEALAGYTFTTKDANGNLSDASDSDADVVTGKTVYTTLSAGETDLTWDAGLTPVCRPVTFDFSGNSSTCGTLGNSRTWTDALTGVSVTARAFSQDKGTNTWQSAWLGAYSGGLGVTDSSEGTAVATTPIPSTMSAATTTSCCSSRSRCWSTRPSLATSSTTAMRRSGSAIPRTRSPA
jgi:serine-aspartate repeat-containing protein C/D/E